MTKGYTYEHQREDRGSGIVAVNSYGPVGELTRITAEARRYAKAELGIASGPVSSGGISGWRDNRICETQTIFVARKQSARSSLKTSAPSAADWFLEIIVAPTGGDTDYDHRYFKGPELDESDWREVAQELADEAGAELLEFTAEVTPQGRHGGKGTEMDVKKAKP